MNGNLQKLINFFQTTEQLKKTIRYLARRKVVRETTADHTWQVAMMVFVLADELDLKINKEKAFKLALIHDLAEALTGDIDYRYILNGKVKEKDKKSGEDKAMKKFSKMLPEKTGKELKDLWAEFELQKSPEARFVNALDKLEAISHLLKIGCKGFKGDQPEIIPNYADKAVSRFPELAGFLLQLKKELKKEFKKGKVQWRNEYDKLKEHG